YRQSSTPPSGTSSDPAAIDPDNALLWRMRLRRLESEVIRDAILAVSGRLDRAQGGPPILLQALPAGMVIIDEKKLTRPAARWRRRLSLLSRRSYPLSLLGVFAQPVVATNCTRRDSSTVPLQSLTLMNDAFFLEHAEQFAARVVERAGAAPEWQIATGFRLA